MSRRLRAIVLWLIAVAIPLQGIAAIVMPVCGPGQFATAAGAAFARAGGEALHAHRVAHDTGILGDAGVPRHGHAMHSHAASGITALDAGHAGHAGHGMLKCCSAGCSMAACSAPSLATHTRVPSIAPVPSEAIFYPGVILDGLDRPPRLLLA